MPNAREIAMRALIEAETRRGVDLKDILDGALSRAELSDADARLATELVYGVVRWRRRLDMIANAIAKKPDRVSRAARALLRLGIYQLLFLDRVPPHAAVFETVALARAHRVEPGFVNAILRVVQRDGDPVKYPDPERSPEAYLARRYSYPDWLVKRWVAERGRDEAEAVCVAYNKTAPLNLRVNALKASREALSERLRNDKVSVTSGAYVDTALLADHLPPLADYGLFRQGWFTIQDESSQLATALLDPQPGDTVFDLCAAPGGKTTAIAERLRDSGSVTAMDASETGLERVRENVARLGLTCVTTRVQDARSAAGLPERAADRVLVDAPCSGVGALRRHADARWGKNDEGVNRLATAQLEMLRNAARAVRPDGALVYGVCTDTREETTEVVKRFCEEEPGFRLDPATAYLSALPSDAFDDLGAMRVAPHRHGLDGFYAARFRRLQ